jgi:hypothetical protein
MKRYLIIVVLAAAVVGLLAVPVVAGAQEPRDFLIGLYYNAPDPGAPIDQDYIWTNTDGYDPYLDWVGRLPSADNGDYVMPYSVWAGFGKGRIQTVPKYLLVTVHIYRAPATGQPLGDPVVGLNAREAKAYWLDPELLDPAPWPSFNGHVGADAYLRWWAWAAPPLAEGHYLLHFTQDFKHPTFDLSVIRMNKTGPYKFMPGDKNWSYDSWFSFTVAK